MGDPVAALKLGRFTAGGAELVLGLTYAEVFKRVPGFPERPRTFWDLDDGGIGEAFAWKGDFLDLKGVPTDWLFHRGQLRQVNATDLEDVGYDNDAARRRVETLIAAWTDRLGPPANTFGLQGRMERSSTWTFPGLQFLAFFETRTPSVGYCVKR
ncbi:MAG TPA: hypothetical protein VF950_25200 [Planctomycetota bacterium]